MENRPDIVYSVRMKKEAEEGVRKRKIGEKEVHEMFRPFVGNRAGQQQRFQSRNYLNYTRNNEFATQATRVIKRIKSSGHCRNYGQYYSSHQGEEQAVRGAGGMRSSPPSARDSTDPNEKMHRTRFKWTKLFFGKRAIRSGKSAL